MGLHSQMRWKKGCCDPQSVGLIDLLDSLLAEDLVPEAAFPHSLMKLIEET
jgi:hypothetical protein